MAIAPQKATRSVPVRIEAPPARAARPPSKARNSSEVADTIGINVSIGVIQVTPSGSTAPVAKAAAEAMAAFRQRER